MKVSAVVVNFHTSDLLPGLFSSLKGQHFMHEIVVSDNSQDNIPCDELSEASDLYVRVLENSSNLGFGNAVNMALKEVSGDYVLIVNPDVIFLPGSVYALVKACEHLNCHVAGPRFYWDDQKNFRLPPATGESMWLELAAQSAAYSAFDAELFSFHWALRHEHFWLKDQPFYEPFLSGACLLVSLSWLKKNEHILFDKRFFLYYEDTDLCVNLYAMGIRPLCVPGAEVIHYWNQSPGENKQSLMQQSCSAFWLKHYGCTPPKRGTPACKSTDCFDLGKISQGYIFECPADFDSPLFFEFAVDPLFVPFAQADMSRPEFTFPRAVWERLAPGDYYARIRSPLSGVQVCWKWKKG